MLVKKKTLMRITTVEVSLDKLLEGQLSFMSHYFRVIGVCSDNGGLQSLAEREGIEIIPVDMTRSITPLQDLRSILRMYRIF